MNDKNLYDEIFERKSIRNFKMEKLSKNELDKIMEFLDQAKVIDKDINFEVKIVNSDDVKSLISIKGPHYLQFFSEEKGDYLLNAGFILQQLDLFLAANNIGACWFGLAKPKKEIISQSDYEYVITLVFGKPSEKNKRNSIEDFDRKKLSEIKEGDKYNDLLEAARLAPSATNGQPWYFKTEEGKIHLYQDNPSFLKKIFYKKMNGIDMGIALAHIWIAAKHNNYDFNFEKYSDSPAEINGYDYIGTVELKS